ncbi:MAG: ParB N-terminal domain-containing protein, partial [Bacteroidetes bacterium]|nr:ParB N-terminal domain-containing protein [Bacteroidota bacterium]
MRLVADHRRVAERRRYACAEPSAVADGLIYVAVDQLQPNPHQPRQDFDADTIASLAQSIRTQGLMQPLVVRPVPG